MILRGVWCQSLEAINGDYLQIGTLRTQNNQIEEEKQKFKEESLQMQNQAIDFQVIKDNLNSKIQELQLKCNTLNTLQFEHQRLTEKDQFMCKKLEKLKTELADTKKELAVFKSINQQKDQKQMF